MGAIVQLGVLGTHQEWVWGLHRVGSKGRALNEGSLWGPANPTCSPDLTLHPKLRSLKPPVPHKPIAGLRTGGWSFPRLLPSAPLNPPSLAKRHFLYSLTAGEVWGEVTSGLTEERLREGQRE